MKKHFAKAAIGLTLLGGSLIASESPLIGVVNFATCASQSKFGQKEHENLEALKNQMMSLIEGTEKELKEIASKFEDTEYLDGLSPKAEEELKMKYQALQEDMGRYQNQFYQVLNHANYQMMQKINSTIASAAEKIAKEKKLDYVMNKEACFYINPDLEVTDQVISEMDKSFEVKEKENKKLSDNSQEMPELQPKETASNEAG